MKFPIIIVNFKTYEQATGEKAVELAKICEKVSKEKNVEIAVAVQETDIYPVSHSVSIPVLSEHVDGVEFGSHTGMILPEAVKDAGAVGTLLNHSEHRLRIDLIASSIKRAKETGLITIVCANTPEVGEAIAELEPDVVAIEPPELIGGEISVSQAKPEIITESVNKIDKPVLVGAGIKTGEDVKKAIELGAKGVLLASGVTKAENPEEVLNELANGLI